MEKPAKPVSHVSSSQKKSKLIISGSLFSKKDKAVPREPRRGAPQKKTKEAAKVNLTVRTFTSFCWTGRTHCWVTQKTDRKKHEPGQL